MYLTNNQIDKFKRKLTELAHDQCTLNANGIFEFYNVDEIKANNIVRSLKDQSFVSFVNKYESKKYNFNHMSFTKGFAEPSKYFNVRGQLDENALKESLTEDLIFNYKLGDAEKLFDLYCKEEDADVKAYLKNALNTCLYQLYADTKTPDEWRKGRWKEITAALKNSKDVGESFSNSIKTDELSDALIEAINLDVMDENDIVTELGDEIIENPQIMNSHFVINDMITEKYPNIYKEVYQYVINNTADEQLKIKCQAALDIHNGQFKVYYKGKEVTEEMVEEEDNLAEIKNQVRQIVNNSTNEFSKIRMFETDDYRFLYIRATDEYESDRFEFYITGGLNGSGKWEDYFNDLSRVFREIRIKTGYLPYIMNVENDCPDDVFTVHVCMVKDDGIKSIDEALEPLKTQFIKKYLKEDFSIEEDVEKHDELNEEGKVIDSDKIISNLKTNKNKIYSQINYIKEDILKKWKDKSYILIHAGFDQVFDDVKKRITTKSNESIRNTLSTFLKWATNIVKKTKDKDILESVSELKKLIKVYNNGLDLIEVKGKLSSGIFETVVERQFKEILNSIEIIFNCFIKYVQHSSVKAESLLESLEEDELKEDVEKHDILNPKLWNEDNTLKPEVEEKLIEIANDFLEGLNDDEIKFNLEDIKIVGSNCSYNYNKDSDLDLHIVMNTESLGCPDNLYPILYNAYKTMWNNRYDPEIKGIPVEIYVETSDTEQQNDPDEKVNEARQQSALKSNGVYSVLHKKWIKEPIAQDIPELDQEAFDKLFNEWDERYKNLINNNPTIESIEKFIEDIYDLRKNSIANEGEYGLGNLVFKECRNLGYIENLKDLKAQLKTKELSLEGLK